MIDPVYSSIDDYVDVEGSITLLRPCVCGVSRRARRLRLCAPRHGIIRVFPLRWESGAGGERGAVGFGTAAPSWRPRPTWDAATGAGISVADEGTTALFCRTIAS